MENMENMEKMEKMKNNEKELEERELKELELMNENENREFYVYVHIRLDNNTVFYVGKGKGDRVYNLDRGNFHNSVCKKYGCRVEIIKDNLTESQAFRLESKMIKYYVLTLGYGIPIDGYEDFSNNYLTNFTWGGEGTSGMNPYANKTPEEMKIIGEKMSESRKGENNPMFGKNPYANKTPEEMEEICKKISEKVSGENNPMFGKNPYANKTPEEMEEIGKKKSEAVSGEKNGMWGKGKKVICITTGKIFDCIKDASNYYKCNNISACCRKKIQSAGKLSGWIELQWKYLEDYNNEFKGILINPIIK